MGHTIIAIRISIFKRFKNVSAKNLGSLAKCFPTTDGVLYFQLPQIAPFSFVAQWKERHVPPVAAREK